MRYNRLRLFFPLVLSVLAGNAIAAPAPTEDSWKALNTEPSRAMLFEAYGKEQSKKPGALQTFAFPYTFHFPASAIRDVDGTLRKDEIFGIDISHWEGANFPFDKLKRQNVAYVYVKATQGTDSADKTFGDNWKVLAALPDNQKIPRGAFHFLSSAKSQTGEQQADRFLAYVALHGGFKKGDLPPAMDLEWDKTCDTCDDRWTTNHRTAQEIIDTSASFLKRVKEKTGRTPLIYTNKSFLNDHGIKTASEIAALVAGSKVWIFDISPSDRKLEMPDPHTNLSYDLWQFTWGAELSMGHSGGFDADVFKGTQTEFDAKFLSDN